MCVLNKNNLECQNIVFLWSLSYESGYFTVATETEFSLAITNVLS